MRWFGHVERMDDYHVARKVLMDVSGEQVRDRPRFGWMDGVKIALGSREKTMKAATIIRRSGEPWCICR